MRASPSSGRPSTVSSVKVLLPREPGAGIRRRTRRPGLAGVPGLCHAPRPGDRGRGPRQSGATRTAYVENGITGTFAPDLEPEQVLRGLQDACDMIPVSASTSTRRASWSNRRATLPDAETAAMLAQRSVAYDDGHPGGSRSGRRVLVLNAVLQPDVSRSDLDGLVNDRTDELRPAVSPSLLDLYSMTVIVWAWLVMLGRSVSHHRARPSSWPSLVCSS